MRLIVVLGALLATITLATGAGAEPAAAPVQVTEAAKPQIQNRCRSARRALAYYRLRRATWRELRGVDTKPRLHQPGGCDHVRWQVERARERARSARLSYQEYRLTSRTLRSVNTWEEAVRQAQKAYPGTEAWLWSCSGTEGGHGEFVQNREGANVWGWVQMHPDTFHRFWVRGWYDPGDGRSYTGAYDSLIKRGFRVQAQRSGSSIDDPLAHALAAAHSLVNGRMSEYHSSGCNPNY